MSEDDRAVMERLAALEAEVKADADAQRARKEAALAKVREQRANQLAERDELRSRQAELVTRKKRPTAEALDPDRGEVDDDRGDGLASALGLAKRANDVKHELTKAPKPGEKSVVKAGIASILLGPLGWLYAGSLRESIPASAAWIAFAALASKVLPAVLLMPILFVVLPLSGFAGAAYAYKYNRKGTRQRLFGDKKKTKSKPKQLRDG